uniref:NADH dehydrogenase subunit 5 n=1 Tax=Ambigolimax valentianus TaxID=1338344 RepID=UPI0024111515|nr:NADH dehydrogenase subunit 5 [Ambigolimax valentianus]WEI33075.1 NADH dehydrogenase subunit 5 [Ambigolimax valentianus]
MLNLKISFINRFTVLLMVSCSLLFLISMGFMKINNTMLVEVSLFNISSIEFSALLILDKISISFGFVVTLISSCVFGFASNYMKEDPYYNRFIIILLSFVISMNLLIYSGSIITILLGWDGLGITSFALIIYYQNKESLNAGFLTLIINRLGDVLIVTSMFFMVMLGQLSIYPISGVVYYMSLFLVLASLTKSAQYPFSPWLPAAMAAPTPVSALVHSSTLVTAGVYLTIRLSFNVPLSYEISTLLCFCGSVTCLLGGAAAIWEMDIKKMIALSTLSQLGVMMFSLGMNFPMMALFHLYTHAMFKALLFLVAGVILMMSFGVQDLRLLGGILYKSPILIIFQNISSLCLIGAPFLSAFYSKHCILELMIMSNLNFFSVLVMLIATMCTVIYVFRSLKILCWSKMIINLNSVYSSFYYYLPLLILGLMGILSGKMFLLINNSVITMMILPNFWNIMMNMIVLVGALIGLMMTVTMKSWSFSSLFFLTPSWNKMTLPYKWVSEGVKSLDYGWLEPKLYLSSLFYINVNKINNLFLWPSVNQHVITRSAIFFSVMLWMWFFMF